MPTKTEEIEACTECGKSKTRRTRRFCARCDVEVDEFHVDWTTWGRGEVSAEVEFCEPCGREFVDGVNRFIDGDPLGVTTENDLERERLLLRRRLDAITRRAVHRSPNTY